MAVKLQACTRCWEAKPARDMMRGEVCKPCYWKRVYEMKQQKKRERTDRQKRAREDQREDRHGIADAAENKRRRATRHDTARNRKEARLAVLGALASTKPMGAGDWDMLCEWIAGRRIAREGTQE